jgi:hypothetical protein
MVATTIGIMRGIGMNNEQIFFDTLHYANRLKAVGVPEKQAEVQAEIMAETINNNLATKRDIKELELKIETLHLKIETLRKDVRNDLKILGAAILLGFTILGILVQLHH